MGTSGSTGTGDLKASKTYTLTCTGPGGSGSGSVTVTVTGTPAPTPTPTPTPKPTPTPTAPPGCGGNTTFYQIPRWCGYFNHQFDNDGLEVLSNGLWDYNANGYLATMHSYLFNGSTQDRTGAAFIILTQLGYQYGSSKSVAVAQSIWGTYDNAIHYLDSHGQIDWNATPSLSCGQANTYFQNSVGADDSAFIMDTSNSTCGTNRASIFDNESG